MKAVVFAVLVAVTVAFGGIKTRTVVHPDLGDGEIMLFSEQNQRGVERNVGTVGHNSHRQRQSEFFQKIGVCYLVGSATA